MKLEHGAKLMIIDLFDRGEEVVGGEDCPDMVQQRQHLFEGTRDDQAIGSQDSMIYPATGEVR